MTALKAYRCCMGLGWLLAWSLALSFPGAAQTPPGVGADILATMDRLAIKLPMEIAASDPVRKPLEELSRERCDQRRSRHLVRNWTKSAIGERLQTLMSVIQKLAAVTRLPSGLQRSSC